MKIIKLLIMMLVIGLLGIGIVSAGEAVMIGGEEAPSTTSDADSVAPTPASSGTDSSDAYTSYVAPANNAIASGTSNGVQDASANVADNNANDNAVADNNANDNANNNGVSTSDATQQYQQYNSPPINTDTYNNEGVNEESDSNANADNSQSNVGATQYDTGSSGSTHDLYTTQENVVQQTPVTQEQETQDASAPANRQHRNRNSGYYQPTPTPTPTPSCNKAKDNAWTLINCDQWIYFTENSAVYGYADVWEYFNTNTTIIPWALYLYTGSYAPEDKWLTFKSDESTHEITSGWHKLMKGMWVKVGTPGWIYITANTRVMIKV